jgi:plasmid stabilization system protein ParE
MKIPEFKAFVQVNFREFSSKIHRKFQAREAQPECQHSDLQTFLLGPIQRIPRYEMLLRDLLRKTDKEHGDHANIKAALNKIEEIMKYINDQKRNSEQIAKVENKLGEKVAQQLVSFERNFIRILSEFIIHAFVLRLCRDCFVRRICRTKFHVILYMWLRHPKIHLCGSP